MARGSRDAEFPTSVRQDTLSNRRDFLRNAAALTAASMAGLAGAPAFSFGKSASGKTLVKIFMPGGSDGLELFPMVGDPFYHRARPNIAFAPAGNGIRSAVKMEGSARALNPNLEPLMDIWSEGRMMVSPATALQDANRSHFDCQRWIGAGTKSDAVDGYLNRYLSDVSENDHVLRAAVLGKSAMSPELNGEVVVPSIADADHFELKSSDFCESDGCEDNRLTMMLREVALPEQGISLAEQIIREEQLLLLETIQEAQAATANNGGAHAYSNTTLGRGLRLVSSLLKAEVPLEVASIDWSLNWDTHANQGSDTFNAGLREGARDLLAFYRDLGPQMDNVIVILGTEFGRTIQENGSRGTDHGKAGAWMAFGGGIRPGFAEDVPTLDQSALGAEARYGLPTLIDYRDFVGEIMVRHMGVSERLMSTIFPRHRFYNHNLMTA